MRVGLQLTIYVSLSECALELFLVDFVQGVYLL